MSVLRANLYVNIFEEAKFGRILLENNRLKLIVFDIEIEEIIEWLP